nr:hypothetical protein [Tanacetum cinerariifolium]
MGTEPSSSATKKYKIDKLLVLASHDSSTPSKDSEICDYVTPTSIPHGDLIRRITFDDMKIDGEAYFGNIEDRNLDSLDSCLSSVQEVQNDVHGIDSGYDTQYDGGYSSEDVGTNDEDDLMVDEENEIIEHDVEVNMFGITNNVPFVNISVTSLLPKEVLEKDDVDVVNVDGFDSDGGYENEVGFKKRKKLKEIESMVLNGTVGMKYIFYYRVREICVSKMSVFTQSICGGPTGPSKAVGVRTNGSSGLNTRSKKRKKSCTIDDRQGSSYVVDAQDKRESLHWFLYVAKEKVSNNWEVRNTKKHTDMYVKKI